MPPPQQGHSICLPGNCLHQGGEWLQNRAAGCQYKRSVPGPRSHYMCPCWWQWLDLNPGGREAAGEAGQFVLAVWDLADVWAGSDISRLVRPRSFCSPMAWSSAAWQRSPFGNCWPRVPFPIKPLDLSRRLELNFGAELKAYLLGTGHCGFTDGRPHWTWAAIQVSTSCILKPRGRRDSSPFHKFKLCHH